MKTTTRCACGVLRHGGDGSCPAGMGVGESKVAPRVCHKCGKWEHPDGPCPTYRVPYSRSTLDDGFSSDASA